MAPHIEFFSSASDFRRWLDTHHASASEVWVGFYKKGSGRIGLTYPEAVDEALCYGWIDGVRRRVDEESYANRFTPRRARSIWSAINIKRIGELRDAGRVAPAGLAAFEARDPKRAGLYSFENDAKAFGGAFLRRFKAERDGWRFFQAQAPSYQRVATFWVLSAAKPETQARRMAELIADSAAGRRLKQFRPEPRAKARPKTTE